MVGHHRPQLDDRVVRLALDPARPYHHAPLVQLEIRRIEEEDLADLRVERIDAERRSRGAHPGRRDREFELDGVRALDEPHELLELRIGERLPCRRRRGHDDESITKAADLLAMRISDVRLNGWRLSPIPTGRRTCTCR